MLTRKNIIDEVKIFLTDLEKLGFPVGKAILFGSIAKGKIHQYSDIDLAVWSSNFTNNYFENIEKTVSLKRTHKNIELHPFSMQQDKNNNPFIEEIENTGIIVSKESVAI